MSIKIKNGIMCGLTTFAVLASTVASPVVAMASDEGQQQVAQQQAAVAKYYAEHHNGSDENHDHDRDDHEKDRYDWDYHNGIMHVQSYELSIGDTIGVSATNGRYGSSDPNVASVDGNGNVTVNNEGSCTIMTYLPDGRLYNKVYINVKKSGGNNNNNNNNKTVYYPVYNPYYVPYYATPVYTTTTLNPTWNAVANNMIAATPQRGTATLASAGPVYLDASFANMLKLRPDVAVNITYGFNGHTFLLSIPRGYNLTSKLNAAGYVDIVALSNVIDGKIRCSLVY